MIATIIITLIIVRADSRDKFSEGHRALRSVEALAKDLGYEMNQYNFIDETHVFKKIGQKTDNFQLEIFERIVKVVNESDKEFKMLLKHLGLEIFEGKELRKIKGKKADLK